MMKSMTVEDLLKCCKSQVAKGNGKKKILISSDDEGNGFHELFYQFTDIEQFGDLRGYQLPFGVNEENIKEYVILG